jgi:hypothetical protein
MPKTVVFVHGYSVRTLSTYAQFPALLVAQGLARADIQLSAFDSLDNCVTCDDLAEGLEDRIASLESQGLDVTKTAFVVHSTGAIIVRRWLLNRILRNRTMPATARQNLPSHFVSLAGANHGSTLAQLGVTIVNRIREDVQGADGVGQQVLTDLDYGSAFLRRLNSEWIDVAAAGELAGVFCFSMVGDDHSELSDQLFWQTKENGCDSTVRICGANLNYSWLTADPDENPPLFNARSTTAEVPHLVLPGFSHTGTKGIIDSVRTAGDAPFSALLEAFAVTDAASYQALLVKWRDATNSWNVGHPDDCSSLLIFRLTDESGRPITDNLILLADSSNVAANVTPSLQSHQPTQNQVDGSVISFYVRNAAFMATQPHKVHIEARSGSPLVDYRNVDYVVSPTLQALVQPNEVTYVEVCLKRDVSNTYTLINFSTNPDFSQQWLPLPT